jgi:hypothetical protein
MRPIGETFGPRNAGRCQGGKPRRSFDSANAVVPILFLSPKTNKRKASFGLGGYLAGRLRIPLRPRSRDEVEFRDGIHGLLVWAIAVLIGAVLAVAVSSVVSPQRRTDAKSSTSSTAERGGIIYDMLPDNTSASGYGHITCKGTEAKIGEQIRAGIVPPWAKPEH